MSEILERYGNKLAEVYEIVKTVEVVNSQRRIIRVEILKNHSKASPARYQVRYWELENAYLQPSYPKENGKFFNSPIDTMIAQVVDYPDVYTNDPESALAQALGWVAGNR